jgi:hypothetical protein
VLPARFDDTGLLPDVAAVDLRGYTSEDLRLGECGQHRVADAGRTGEQEEVAACRLDD